LKNPLCRASPVRRSTELSVKSLGSFEETHGAGSLLIKPS
jgi:hypothetical protein